MWEQTAATKRMTIKASDAWPKDVVKPFHMGGIKWKSKVNNGIFIFLEISERAISRWGESK